MKIMFCLISVLFVAGCSMSIGSYERGLWYDHDAKDYNPKCFGLKLDLVAGRCVRPFGKDKWGNPDCYWDFPFIGPFISVSLGEYGAYLGFKSFKNYKDRYPWLPTEADPNDPDILFTLSSTTRRTRWK